jgi:hypothetical protein
METSGSAATSTSGNQLDPTPAPALRQGSAGHERAETMTEPTRWMKPAQAAVYACVPEATIRRWIRDGYLKPAVTRAKRDIHGRGASGFVLDSRDIDALLEALKQCLPDRAFVFDPKKRQFFLLEEPKFKRN